MSSIGLKSFRRVRLNPISHLVSIFIAILLVGCSLVENPVPTITPLPNQIPTDTLILLPDLTIRSVSVVSDSSEQCSSADQVYHTNIRIQNIGKGPAGPFVVRVNLDQKLINQQLLPEQSIDVQFPGYEPNISVLVDSTSLVIEQDESNNQIIERPDLPTIPPQCLATATPDIVEQEASAVLEGHTAAVRDVKFSPDGRTISSGSVDDTLRLWGVDPPRLIRTMQGHPFPILMLDYSPTGSVIYTGSMDGIIRAWEVSTGSLIQTLEGHVGWITGIDVSDDGRWLASAAEDSTVRLWRLPTGSVVQIIDEGMTSVCCAAFAPGSKTLGWGENDGTLRLRTVGGEWLYTNKSSNQPLTSLVFSPDGAVLVTGYADGVLRVWNADDGSLSQSIYGHTDEISDLAFSTDGRWLVSGSKDHSLRLWKYENDRFISIPVRIYTGHTAPVTGVAISPTMLLIASCSEDSTIRFWEIP